MLEDADVRAVIEHLADSGGLSNSAAPMLERYMLKVSERIAPAGDHEFAELLHVARLNIEEGCAPEVLREARIRAVDGRDARRGIPQLEAAYRTIRFLLEPRGNQNTDWFAVLWEFVEQAERGGASEKVLRDLLSDETVERRGQDKLKK